MMVRSRSAVFRDHHVREKKFLRFLLHFKAAQIQLEMRQTRQ